MSVGAFHVIERAWHDFADSQPGRRFEDRYWRRRHSEHNLAKRIAGLAAGVVLLALGLFFAVAPGPGMLLLLPGAGLIAQESLTVARALDRIELRIRRLFQ